jgi:hypothetical protein
MQDQRNGHTATRQASPMVASRDTSTGESPEVEALAQWIAECISSGRLVALGLGSRSAVDASLSPICSWEEEDFDKYPTPQDLAPVIMAAAVHDASSQRGTTRYVVNAYRGGERAHFRKYSFRLDGGLEFTDKDEINYPPTEAGVLAMAMKHAEFAIRSYSAGQAESMRLLSGQVRELHSQNNKLAQQQYKVLDLQQQMLDRQAERELAIREQDAKEKRKQMMFEKFLVLWPIIAKKFLGGKDKGSDTMLAEEQLGTLLESMDEEQVRQLVPILSEEQKIGFFTVYQEYKSRKKRLAEPGHEESKAGASEAAPEADPQPEPEPQAEPEAPFAEEVAASAQDMAYEAAADVTVAEVEAPAQTEAPVEAAAAEADVSATIAAPAGDVAAEAATEPEPDRTFELMVDVMGDDLNDEKVGRLAEKLDAGKRKLFLAAVAAKRAIIESATVVEASAASAVEGSAEAANTGTEVSTDGGVGSANGSS